MPSQAHPHPGSLILVSDEAAPATHQVQGCGYTIRRRPCPLSGGPENRWFPAASIRWRTKPPTRYMACDPRRARLLLVRGKGVFAQKQRWRKRPIATLVLTSLPKGSLPPRKSFMWHSLQIKSWRGKRLQSRPWFFQDTIGLAFPAQIFTRTLSFPRRPPGLL